MFPWLNPIVSLRLVCKDDRPGDAAEFSAEFGFDDQQTTREMLQVHTAAWSFLPESQFVLTAKMLTSRIDKNASAEFKGCQQHWHLAAIEVSESQIYTEWDIAIYEGEPWEKSFKETKVLVEKK